MFGRNPYFALPLAAIARYALLSLLLMTLSSNLVAAPELDIRGKDAAVKLSQFKNKLIYLDFWATWCSPCRYSFPWMEKMQQKYRDAGLTVVAISIDGKREVIDRFLQDNKVSFTVLQDNHMHSANAYGVDAMPSSFLIGENGEILYHHRGFNNASKEILENKIRAYLKN